MTQTEKFTVLRAIAAALSGTELRQAEPDFTSNPYAWLHFSVPAGVMTVDYVGDRKGDYVHVSGVWPRDHAGHVILPRDCMAYGTQPVSINVSAKKSADQAARDITRRFLPEFTVQYAACIAIVQSRKAYDDAVAANYGALAEAAGTIAVRYQHREGWHVQGLPDSVTIDSVCADNVRLTLRLSIAEACELMRQRAELQRNAAELEARAIANA